jgi:UDP-N-acetylmuramyl pentapeptide phosphotransferase/UDP-N-acetylglucosamine-1-phosphate transferase
MGDVGSAFLGYTFAALAVIAAQSHPRYAVAGILLVGPFVFDTLFTFFRRLRAGENVFTAHRSHLYQRLIIVGYSHRSVTLLYISLAGVFVALAYLWCAPSPWVDTLLVVSVPAVCLALWRFVVRQEHRQVLCR